MNMADSTDFNCWLRQLECPQRYATEHLKKMLHKGVLGLLWEDLPRIIRPVTEVSEVRKNILLYKIKHEPKDSLINNIKNKVRLKEERKQLNIKIKKGEEKWNQLEFVCRSKENLLEKRKMEKQNLMLKKEILRKKKEEMLIQIDNCKKMQEICHNLMPPSVEDIDQSIISECLSLVSNYSGGPEKRKVYHKISQLLDHVKVPVLWNALLSAQSNSNDLLINSDIKENQEKTTKSSSEIDIGTANICSEHLKNVAMRFIYMGRAEKNEKITVEYLEKIEQIIDQRPDLNEWLPLILEVHKLEIYQTELQRELQKLEEQIPIADGTIDEILMQLISEIKDEDNKIAACVHEIQNAFGCLKSSIMFITKIKEFFISEMDKFQLLQTCTESQWLDVELSTELTMFYKEINIDSLRKIMLKGETGVYRHLKTCFNKASIALDIPNNSNKPSVFPMLRVPVYYLVDFFKTYIINKSLSKCITEITDTCENQLLPTSMDSTIVPPHQGILELLRLADLTCKSTLDHCQEFEKILKTWSNQTVHQIVSKIFSDKTVYGATLHEWEKRFSMIVYVLQKSNITAVT